MLKSWRRLGLLWDIMVKKNAAAARRKFTSQNVEIMKGVRATLGNNFQQKWMRLWHDAHLQAKIEKKKFLPLKKRAVLVFAVPLPNQTRSLGCSAGTFATSSSSFEVGTRTEFGNVKPPAVKLLHERIRNGGQLILHLTFWTCWKSVP